MLLLLLFLCFGLFSRAPLFLIGLGLLVLKCAFLYMYIHFLIRTKKNHNVCIILMYLYICLCVCVLTRVVQFNAFQSFLFDCFAFSVCWRFYSTAPHGGRNHTENKTLKRGRLRERVLFTTKLSQHGSECTHTLKRPALSIFVLALSHAGKKQVNGLKRASVNGIAHVSVSVSAIQSIWSWTLPNALL